MSAEPLWRGKTTQQGPWNTYSFLTEEDGDLPALDCRPGTEVEVWPAGDRPKAASGEWQAYLATNGWVILDKDSQHPVCITKSDTADEMVRSLVETHNKAIRAAGDRTPTYEQVAQALKDASVGADGPDGLYRTMFLDVATRAVWALLHGEGDETDGG